LLFEDAINNNMWSSYVNISHVSGQGSKEKVQAHISYLMRENECIQFWSNSHDEVDIEKFKVTEKQIWKMLNEKEKRVNSRMQSRLIIPLPNGLSASASQKIFTDISEELNAHGNVHITAALHKGDDTKNHRNGIPNLHMHIDFSDRDIKTFKKIRALSDRKQSAEILRKIKVIVEENINDNNIKTGIRIDDLRCDRHFSHKVVQEYRRIGKTENKEYQAFLEKKRIQEEMRMLYWKYKQHKKKEDIKKYNKDIKKYNKELDDEISSLMQQRQQSHEYDDILNPKQRLKPEFSENFHKKNMRR
jgi:hypothetical protein